MSTNPKIAIVDYGLSNLYSISKALQRFTDNAVITDELSILEAADGVVLPGVGSFEEGMKGLQARGLVPGLKAYAASGKPLLGICLGAQLMLSRGYEFGTFAGLDIIAGEVVRFPELAPTKIPHIGWNGINTATEPWEGSVLEGLGQCAPMYFVHSYVLKPDHLENVLAKTEYGGYEFCSVIQKGQVYGCQFHPEKNGEEGLAILKNFVTIASRLKL